MNWFRILLYTAVGYALGMWVRRWWSEETAGQEALPATPITLYQPPPTPAKEPQTADDLTRIVGIGPAYAERFQQAGIHTFAQIAQLTADEIRQRINLEPWQGDPENWVEQAAEFSG